MPCSDSDQYISTLTHSLAYELWKELEGSVGELDGASFRCGLNACVVVGRIDEANSTSYVEASTGMPSTRRD